MYQAQNLCSYSSHDANNKKTLKQHNIFTYVSPRRRAEYACHCEIFIFSNEIKILKISFSATQCASLFPSYMEKCTNFLDTETK